MAKVELICEFCGKKFLRDKSEVNRNKKKGRKTYCSLSCAGKLNNNHLRVFDGKYNCNLKANKSDLYSPFRWHLRNMNQRKHMCDVTLEDLKRQWEKQKGRCPYTGWKLKNLINMCHNNQLPRTPDRASVDRIDSSKPYTKDNIQFVSLMAQLAKNIWPENELLSFCESVVANKQIV
jgi:hypothetical protein